MRLAYLLALALPLTFLAVDGCGSEVECEVTLTCPCSQDAQCDARQLDGVDECNLPVCLASGQCGVEQLQPGTPCGTDSTFACDLNGVCSEEINTGGGAGPGGGGAGGSGGAGGQFPGYPSGDQVALGSAFSCVLLSGNVKCWGRNDDGETGVGTLASTEPNPKDVALPLPALEVSAGAFHACARLVDGSVHCWGRNADGQLGDGSFQMRRDPTPVNGIAPVIQIHASSWNTFVLHEDGTVSSWGRGDGLGDGSMPGENSGVPVSNGITDVLRIADETCVLKTNGRLSCWGTAPTYAPVVASASTVTDGANSILWGADSETFLCLATTLGNVQCRGGNFCGVLGLGQGTTSVSSLTGVSGVSDVNELECSTSYCLARSDGGMSFWGTVVPAECEDNGIIDAWVPTTLAVPGGGAVAHFDVGGRHACMLTDDDEVFCWGSNQSGEQGNGSTGGIVATPTAVGGL